jgi:hypothetical protein
MCPVGGGARLAVAAAAGVLTVCVSGAPLYVSSVGSESVQLQLSQMCLADAGLYMFLGQAGTLTFGGKPIALVEEQLAAIIADLDHAQPPVVTTSTAVMVYSPSTEQLIGPTLRFFHRGGQYEHLPGGPPTMGEFDALVPEWTVDSFNGRGRDFFVRVPSETMVIDPETGEPARDQATWKTFHVAGTYPDIPRPEPTYWCGMRELFRLSNLGERPRPAVFVDAATMALLPSDRTLEVRPDPRGMTLDDATALLAGFQRLNTRYARELGFGDDGSQIVSNLPTVISRAEGQRDLVARSLAPVELGGILTAAGLLVASGVMLARERRRDLRLRVLRGVGPPALAARIAAGELLPVALGGAVGAVVAFAGIRVFGPTPELESGPVRLAVVSSLLGVVVATALVAAVAAVATARTVDRRPIHRHRLVPWELVPIGLAVASFVRLDDVGGVRLSGPEARGGDLLAQAFPQLAVLAPLALLARPLGALLRRSARTGGRLPVPLLLGVRRIAHASGAYTMLTLAIALGVGSYVVSNSLTASAEQMLADKSETFVGADMAVRTGELGDLPVELDGRATQVGAVEGRLDGRRAELLGVDRATFEDVVRWREDASGSSLTELLDRVADDAPIEPSNAADDALPVVRAVVVGPVDGGSEFSTRRGPVAAIEQVGSARWFPGFSNGTTLVVVDLDALRATGLDLRTSVWLRDPPSDALTMLMAAGFEPARVDTAHEVFDVTSYKAVGWAYAPLGVFAIMVGCATLMAQLLVLSAGRRARQSTWTLTSRMGMRLRDETAAVLTELGIPLVLGGALGLVFGWLALRLAVPRFDTLRQLEPPARTILDVGSVGVAAGTAVATMLALAALSLVAIARTRPMEVMRGGN